MVAIIGMGDDRRCHAKLNAHAQARPTGTSYALLSDEPDFPSSLGICLSLSRKTNFCIFPVEHPVVVSGHAHAAA
jgi:hypothetical protein